jgi:hypothetical protein
MLALLIETTIYGRRVAPFGQIILIPSQLVLFFNTQQMPIY